MEQQTQGQIADLQARVAEQENAIDSLGETVHEQWQKIVELTTQVEQLQARLFSLEGNAETALPSEPPPPHH